LAKKPRPQQVSPPRWRCPKENGEKRNCGVEWITKSPPTWSWVRGADAQSTVRWWALGRQTQHCASPASRLPLALEIFFFSRTNICPQRYLKLYKLT
jgi:hypothetical protein